MRKSTHHFGVDSIPLLVLSMEVIPLSLPSLPSFGPHDHWGVGIKQRQIRVDRSASELPKPNHPRRIGFYF